MSNSNSDMCDVVTVQMSKFTGGNSPDSDIYTATLFAEVFSMWFSFVSFDVKSNSLTINISYLKNHFYKEELLSTIKFFMQYNDYYIIDSYEESKPVDE